MQLISKSPMQWRVIQSFYGFVGSVVLRYSWLIFFVCLFGWVFLPKKFSVVQHLNSSPRIKCKDDHFLLSITAENPSFHSIFFCFPLSCCTDFSMADCIWLYFLDLHRSLPPNCIQTLLFSLTNIWNLGYFSYVRISTSEMLLASL